MIAGICFKTVWGRGLTKQVWLWDEENMKIFYNIIFTVCLKLSITKKTIIRILREDNKICKTETK